MLVLLDRDGVINEDISPNGVTSPEEFRLIPGSAEAIAMLNHAGYKVAVVTNQSAIGKGLLTQEGLEEIHDLMCEQLIAQGAHIDAIAYCPDHPDNSTHRRKPNPGMLEEMLSRFGEEAEMTPLVGDALRDMEAAVALGCPRYWVKTGKGERVESHQIPIHIQPVVLVDNLLDAVRRLLA